MYQEGLKLAVGCQYARVLYPCWVGWGQHPRRTPPPPSGECPMGVVVVVRDPTPS
jgi:hypothetical protein